MASANAAVIALTYVVSAIGVHELVEQAGRREQAGARRRPPDPPRRRRRNGSPPPRPRRPSPPRRRGAAGARWIARLPLLVGGESFPIRGRIAFVVAARRYVRHSSRNGPPPARAVAGHDREERVPGRDDVVAVDGVARQPVQGDHVGHPLDVCAERGVNSAKPLFSHTSTSGSRHSVARLTVSWKWPTGRRRRRRTRPRPCRRRATMPRARSRGRSARCPHHSRRAHEAMLHVEQVHRPAGPGTDRRRVEQLGHRAVERRPLCDRVPVGTVPGEYGVVVAKLQQTAAAIPSLTHARVDQAVGLVGAREPPTASSNSRIRHIVASRRSACAPRRQPRHRSGGHERRPTTRTESPSSCWHDRRTAPALQLASTPGDRRVRIGFDPDIPLSTRPL